MPVERIVSRRAFIAHTSRALVAGAAMGAAWGQGGPALLRLTAVPGVAPDELAREFTPLCRWLERRLEIPVEWVAVTTYTGAVQALVERRVEMAWLGGLTFVQSNLRSDGKTLPLVQREEDAVFQSVFITRHPAAIKTLEDLKGRVVAFGSSSSTSGHLMPRSFMLAAKVDPERDLKSILYTGRHDATILAVAQGKADVGALSALVWHQFVERGKVDPGDVSVFYTTPPYYNGNLSVHADLPAELRERITQAFLALGRDTPEGAHVLKLQRASRYITTSAGNYSGIRAAAEMAGLLK